MSNAATLPTAINRMGKGCFTGLVVAAGTGRCVRTVPNRIPRIGALFSPVYDIARNPHPAKLPSVPICHHPCPPVTPYSPHHVLQSAGTLPGHSMFPSLDHAVLQGLTGKAVPRVHIRKCNGALLWEGERVEVGRGGLRKGKRLEKQGQEGGGGRITMSHEQ